MFTCWQKNCGYKVGKDQGRIKACKDQSRLKPGLKYSHCSAPSMHMSCSPLLVSVSACSSAPRLDIDEVGTVLLKTDGDKEGEKNNATSWKDHWTLSLCIYAYIQSIRRFTVCFFCAICNLQKVVLSVKFLCCPVCSVCTVCKAQWTLFAFLMLSLWGKNRCTNKVQHFFGQGSLLWWCHL